MSEISETEIKSMTKEQNYMRGYENGKSDVLVKIRLDIAQEIIPRSSDEYGDEAKWLNTGLRTALEVIDKYKSKVDKMIEKEEAIKIFQDKITKTMEHKQEPFDDTILTLTNRVVTQVTEDMNNFIFTTIKPWCEEKEQRIISKRDLEQALTQYFSKEPCEDCISRQAAIDACLSGWNKDYKEIVEEIRTLPPVKPQEPKKGHWIIGKYRDTCSECRCTYPKKIGIRNFCPACGAKMSESEVQDDAI